MLSVVSNRVLGPTLTFPGTIPRTKVARFFRYIGKLSSDLPCTRCHGSSITSIRLAEGFRLPSRRSWVEMLNNGLVGDPKMRDIWISAAYRLPVITISNRNTVFQDHLINPIFVYS